MVVVLSPLRQFLPHILQGEEDFHVQALIAEASVEAFDEAVLDRLARSNKIQQDAMAIGPVSFPVKETVAMENFRRLVEPDTWPAVSPPRHHGAALHCRSGTIPH